MADAARSSPPLPPDRPAIEAMWTDLRRCQPGLVEHAPLAVVLGDTAVQADRLVQLVIDGNKRAGAALAFEFAGDGDALPRVGDYGVVCDGSGKPRVVVRTMELRLGPIPSVDEAFARDDLGDGDRSQREWLRVHREFFTRRCRELDIAYHDQLEVVFERFRVVWPPELADPR
jgi:uncharacterized protein YhfF